MLIRIFGHLKAKDIKNASFGKIRSLRMKRKKVFDQLGT